MKATFATLLWVLFGYVCTLYDQVLKLWRLLNHLFIKSVKSKFTRIRYDQITWQVLEETRLFFDQWLGPNNFTNGGPIISPTSDLELLIEDVRRNTFLNSVTMPRKCNNQDIVNTWETHHVKIQGGNMQENGVFPGAVQRPTCLDPYSTQSRKWIEDQNSQGKGCQAQKP